MKSVMYLIFFVGLMGASIPLCCLDSSTAIQQKILSIRRNTVNLEQLLLKHKDAHAFYNAPQTCSQVNELLAAATSLQDSCIESK